MLSIATVQPSASQRTLTQSRTCRSKSVSVRRQMPPFGVAPIAAVSISSPQSRSASITRFCMAHLARSEANALRYAIAVRRARPQLRRSAQILIGPRDIGAELLGGEPAPVRVLQHGAAKRDHVGVAARDDVLGLARRRNQTDDARGDASLALDLRGERHVVTGS